MKGSTCAYGMVRDGNGSRTSRPIIGRMWASSSRTISRSPVSICVVMVRCSFRSSPLLVVVAGRRFRSPADAAARFVTEGPVLRPPTAAQGCTDLAHAPGGHLDAQVSAQVYRSVADELYPGRLLGLLTRSLLQPVVQRAARAATHDLGHLLRGHVLRLDPRPLLDVEDALQATDALGKVQATPSVVEDCHARGGVRPCVGDRQFFSICGRLLAHSPSPRASQGPQGRGTHRGGAR